MGNDNIKREQINIRPSVSSLLNTLLWQRNTGEFWTDELQTDRQFEDRRSTGKLGKWPEYRKVAYWVQYLQTVCVEGQCILARRPKSVHPEARPPLDLLRILKKYRQSYKKQAWLKQWPSTLLIMESLSCDQWNKKRMTEENPPGWWPLPSFCSCPPGGVKARLWGSDVLNLNLLPIALPGMNFPFMCSCWKGLRWQDGGCLFHSTTRTWAVTPVLFRKGAEEAKESWADPTY